MGLIKNTSILGSLITSLVGLTSFCAKAEANNDLVDQLYQNCQNTVELNYQSQKLRSPNGNTSVYFDVTLRRLGERDYRSFSYCPPSGFQTPKVTMVVETPQGQRNIGFQPTNFAYMFMKPISFSPDGRYIVVEGGYAFDGGDGGSSLKIIDLQNNYQSLPILMCKRPDSTYEADYLEYQGFVSTTQMYVFCQIAYGGSGEWTEVVDLSRQTTRRVSGSNSQSRSYGTVVSPLRVVKRQVFPAQR